MKSLFQRLTIAFLVFSFSVFIVACSNSAEEADAKLEKEINEDPEVAPNDTIEILDESEQISLELNEELNEEIDKQVNDKDIDDELDHLLDDADKTDSDIEIGPEDEDDDLK